MDGGLSRNTCFLPLSQPLHTLSSTPIPEGLPQDYTALEEGVVVVVDSKDHSIGQWFCHWYIGLPFHVPSFSSGLSCVATSSFCPFLSPGGHVGRWGVLCSLSKKGQDFLVVTGSWTLVVPTTAPGFLWRKLS